MALNPEDLMQQARRESGLEAFGDAPLAEPLAVLCRSLNAEAGLTATAETGAAAAIVGSLAERLRIEDWLRRAPEILDQRITAPLNVLGLPRSGTTALSQFLSEDPALRSIRRWELYTPTPPPDDALGDADPRIEATRQAFAARDQAMPAYRAMLPVAAEDVAEHNAPMSFTVMNIQTATIYDVPSYGEWLLNADLAPAYAYLAKVLKLLQWKAPRERWNLKNPMDLFVLPAFHSVFPDARLIWLHRDPASTIGSMCSLIGTIREDGGQVFDKARFGQALARFMARGAARGVRDRDALGLEVADIYNRDLGKDPVGVIGGAYEQLGLTFSDAFRDRLQARLRDRPRGQFGRHDYALADFGLTKAGVRALFAEYIDRFDVPLED